MIRAFVSLVICLLATLSRLSAHELFPLEPQDIRVVTQEVPYLVTDRSVSEVDVWDRKDFRSSEKPFVRLGFVDEVIWLKVVLNNSQAETQQIYLEFPWSRWSEWRLSEARVLVGDTAPKAVRVMTHRSPMVHFTMPARTQAVWLLRVESVYGLQWIVRSIGFEKAQETLSDDRFYMGLYLGIVGFAVFFFLAVSLESRLRLAFDFVVLLLTLYLLLIPSVLGYEQVMFGFSPWIRDRATFLLVWPALWATFRLQKNLEEVNGTKTVRKLQVLLLGFSAVCLAVSFVSWKPWLIEALVALSFAYVCLTLLETVLALRGMTWRALFFAMAWLILTLAGIFYGLMLGHEGLLAWFESGRNHFWLALAALGSLGFFSLALADAYRTMQRDILREQTQRQSWEQAMRGAHEVQETFIQGNSESEWYEIRPGYHPCEATGGDWLGYRFDQQRQQLYLGVADVDGHGFSAALVAGTIHGAFYSEALLAESIDGQREGWLRKMVQHLHALVHITEHSTLRSVTLVGCCLDFNEGRLHYINVGHVPVMLLRDGKVQTLFAIGSPLGLTDEPLIGEKFVSLQAEDRLLLITDGILAERSRADTLIKLKDVAACLRSDESLQENQSRIEALIRDIKVQKKDDCTYILLRVKKAKT